MVSTKIFRFDDISLNSDVNLVNSITDFILQRVPDAQILFCISPMVNNECGERAFPSKFHAFADHRKFFNVDKIGVPVGLHSYANLAGHGLVHVDHRLLSKELQEFSILTSCAISKCKTFVPPFNKWNRYTEEICNEHGIKLVKFEDGWLSAEHNAYNSSHAFWYLHSYEWTMDKIVDWFNNKVL